MDQLEALIKELYSSIREDNFARLTLSKPRDKSSEVKKIIIKMAIIKGKRHFSFVYRHQIKDVTKNKTISEGSDLIVGMIQSEFEIANLFTIEKHIVAERLADGSFKVKSQAQNTDIKVTRSHDKLKKSLLKQTDYLIALEILNKKGNIQKDKGDKYKQINKFVEIIDGILRKNASLAKLDPMQIFDMGSGKGYLTFALYDYLKNTQNKNVGLRGIEMRADLVEKCNRIAEDVKFDQLIFEEGTIQHAHIKSVDILIALHACDTATDDAISKGISAGAKLIICSPCCHKQVRRDIDNKLPSLNAIYKHGILQERQAEIITDTIRALILELNGYKTNVFEFISTEHTGKNLIISAIKHQGKVDRNSIQKEIDALKSQFGLEKHYLEGILE